VSRPRTAEELRYIAAVMAAFLAAASIGPTTISAAALAAGLVSPPSFNLRIFGRYVIRAERAGKIVRVDRVSGSRPAAHGSPVLRWVTSDWQPA